VADRCARLLESDTLVAEVDRVRAWLHAAAVDELPVARAAGSELAWRAASQLVVARGARSVLRSEHAQRLAREALFLLVFGSRPPIRAELLRRVAGRAG
jgi:alkylation response protein AidB-like acyl-CoA dehydrogenase